MNCVICQQPIAEHSVKGSKGYDASPVAKGLCCGDCNWNHVGPAILRKHRRRMRNFRKEVA